MTRRERFEAALRREEVDRVPFWVKIFGPSYLRGHPDAASMSELELADYLDLDHMAGGPSPVTASFTQVELVSERRGNLQVTKYVTPDGTLGGADRFDPGSDSWHPVEFPIKTDADLRAARHVFSDAVYSVDETAVERCVERLRAVGERGVTMVGMGISPLMNLIQHFAGPDRTYYLLQDHPEEMDELIQLMHEDRLRYLEVLLRGCPYDYVVSVENTSTTLLSPAFFERYCWRHLNDYGQLITGHNKQHVLHMCGHLKALLPCIDKLPAVVIEAYTTPPVGNSTLADREVLCPNTAVIGGTNATLWLKPVGEICAEIEQALDEVGTLRGLVLTSAGEMPRLVPLERIREVRQFAYSLVPSRWR